MLYTPTICHVAITRTLIDGEAGLNMLPPEAFGLLHVPPSRLRSSEPFSGVGGGSTKPLRQIRLPVTFGTCDNYRTELVDFNIAKIDLSYNVILGYPALAQFMAATHPAYNLMKMPGSNGALTVAGDMKGVLQALRLALRAATSALPSKEKGQEAPEASPTKKKQLFSQDRAETKQVPICEDGTASATFII